MTLKLVWGLTGSGDKMPETLEVVAAIRESEDVQITAALSKAALQVMRWYKLYERLEEAVDHVLIEKDANAPFIVGRLQIGEFDGFIVAPATANTVAKIVHGIADTLISNAVAQTNKTDLPVYVMPVDREPGITRTVLPNGDEFTLRIREVDVENARRLAAMPGIEVLSAPGDIRRAVDDYRIRMEAG
ncbi:MAG: archaeoflavoprotein AfpA [Thermoleophilia bacterium]